MPDIFSILKFSFVALCFLFALVTRERTRDGWLLRAALFLTVCADFNMVLFGNNLPGLIFFCAVQSVYCVRYASVRYAAGLCAAWVISAAVMLALKTDALNLFTVLYALSFVFSLTAVYRAKKYARPYDILTRLGMTLFFLCDVNVALYNAVPAHAEVFYVLLWIFYLPSQAVLALSAACHSCHAI